MQYKYRCLSLDSCSPLQILFCLCCELVIESCGLLVEAHVTVIDIVYVSIFINSSPTTEL